MSVSTVYQEEIFPELILSSDARALSPEEALQKLGNKGAQLLQMTQMGLRVPPFFVLTTQALHQGKLSSLLKIKIKEAIRSLEVITGKTFGSGPNPLSFSVRSSGITSMPGMLDTVLNVGFNDSVCTSLCMLEKNFSFDSYAHFLSSYSRIVLGLPPLAKKSTSQHNIASYKQHILNHTGQEISSDSYMHLWEIIEAIAGSWMNPRAIDYRKLFSLSEEFGMAIVVQMMIFGNRDEKSATGVAFSRNPSTGKKGLFGEYLVQAQGDHIVSGTHTPQAFHEPKHPLFIQTALSELEKIAQRLEAHYADMQDIEFTIESETLWILQTRIAKRTAEATLLMLSEHVEQKTLSIEDALMSIDTSLLSKVLHGQLCPPDPHIIFLGEGLPASPGPAVGSVSLSADNAIEQAKQGKDVILIRQETSPDDIIALRCVKGLVTAQGGMTSHAAVIARGMGLPCVTGVRNLTLSLQQHSVFFGNMPVRVGDIVTIDGESGKVFLGKGTLISVAPSTSFQHIMSWADKKKRMAIYTNAETVDDIKNAFQLGAEGVGLCRTEHMFFEEQLLFKLQQIILSATPEERSVALEALLPLQEEAFYKLLAVTKEKMLTVRLLDPPLHEFLPSEIEKTFLLAKAFHLSSGMIQKRIDSIKEHNPMLGSRGCRLFTTIPGLYEMQTMALARAALRLAKQGQHISLGILIPFVTFPKEFTQIKSQLIKILKTILESHPLITYQLGAMVETPSSAFYAADLAEQADFLSFGTNDMTQMALGLSRDDSADLLESYKNNGLLLQDPFQHIEKTIVGHLMDLACQRARKANPNIVFSVCGEHAGDPFSIPFFESLGIDSLSCSPYRVPLARLAAAQAFIKKD